VEGMGDGGRGMGDGEGRGGEATFFGGSVEVEGFG